MLVFYSLFGFRTACSNEYAPYFNMPDLKGKMVSLENFKGKVVLLHFWATWCRSCREDLPEIEALYRKYRSDGFEIVSVCVDKSEDRFKRYIQNIPVSFTLIIDKNGDIADAYRFSGLPAWFLIDREGAIKNKHIGFDKTSLAVYEKEITDLLRRN